MEKPLKNQLFLAFAIFAIIFLLTTCDENIEVTPFEGTWIYQYGGCHNWGNLYYSFTGNKFTKGFWGKVDKKGYFTFDDTKLTITFTHHEFWERLVRYQVPVRTTVEYTLDGNTLILFNSLLGCQGLHNYELNGTWRRQ